MDEKQIVLKLDDIEKYLSDEHREQLKLIVGVIEIGKLRDKEIKK